jgi:hypothetical protein
MLAQEENILLCKIYLWLSLQVVYLDRSYKCKLIKLSKAQIGFVSDSFYLLI